MKKVLFIFALALFALPAIATSSPGGDVIFRTKKVDTKVFTVLLANLQQETASITIQQLDGDQIFTQTVKHHNGFNQKFDFTKVPNGRYVLTVEHEGKTYSKVIYVNEETVLLSPVNTKG